MVLRQVWGQPSGSSKSPSSDVQRGSFTPQLLLGGALHYTVLGNISDICPLDSCCTITVTCVKYHFVPLGEKIHPLSQILLTSVGGT